MKCHLMKFTLANPGADREDFTSTTAPSGRRNSVRLTATKSQKCSNWKGGDDRRHHNVGGIHQCRDVSRTGAIAARIPAPGQFETVQISGGTAAATRGQAIPEPSG